MFKKVHLLSKIAALAFSLPLISFSQVINNSNLTVFPVFTPAPPTLDGELDDYCWTESNILGEDNSQNIIDNSSGLFKNLLNNMITIDADGVKPFPNDRNNQVTSFSTAWDETYLYMAAKVKSPSSVAFRNAKPTEQSAEALELFLNNGEARTSINPGEPNFPQIYNALRDAQMVLSYKNTPDVSIIPAKGLGHGMLLEGSSAVCKNTTEGYIIECRIPWKSINKEFIDDLTLDYGTTPAAQASKPSNTRKPLGFDISNNIATTDKNPENNYIRRGQLMWNQCCWNCNWTISKHFGVMVLKGVPGVISVIGIDVVTKNGSPFVISNAGENLTLKSIITPRGANPIVEWTVQGISNLGFPLAIINELGVITPFSDGSVTVTATSVGNRSYTKSVVVEISNQPVPTDISIDAPNITSNWGYSNVVSTVLPAFTPQNVTYSLDPVSLESATINSITGSVRSKSLTENSVITVTATSLANGLKKSKEILINNQVPVNCFSLNSYQFINQCSKYPNTLNGLGYYTMRAGSYSTSDKMSFNFEYSDIFNTTGPGIIPREFTTLSVLGTPLGVGRSALSSTPDAHILSLSSSTIVITLSGSYIYNPSLRYTVVMTASTNRNTITSTCNGNVFSINNAPPLGCGGTHTLTGVTSQSEEISSLSLFPNPATESVTVSANGLSSVIIYSLVGMPVVSVTVSSGETKISTGNLAAGIYIVSAQLKNGSRLTKKLIIEK
ncbi:MAG: T9SS C-terminal target domain-containing protein [Cytophagales bacterium]|nr:MAG: T9SS C-terminal target domain-containing protein [Cytophagales bacterium]